jgi:hypothetical protein
LRRARTFTRVSRTRLRATRARKRAHNARVFCTRDARRVFPLDDGEYDCVVTDVARDDDGVVVDLAISSGDAKGHVVRLRVAMNDEPIHWLGLPGRLRVTDGVPTFRLDGN